LLCVLQTPFFTRTIVVVIIIPGFNRPLTMPVFCPSFVLQPNSFGPMTCRFRSFLPLHNIRPGMVTSFGIEVGMGGRFNGFCLSSNVGSLTMGNSLSSGGFFEGGLTQGGFPSSSGLSGQGFPITSEVSGTPGSDAGGQ